MDCEINGLVLNPKKHIEDWLLKGLGPVVYHNEIAGEPDEGEMIAEDIEITIVRKRK